jgi:hypothetical protein
MKKLLPPLDISWILDNCEHIRFKFARRSDYVRRIDCYRLTAVLEQSFVCIENMVLSESSMHEYYRVILKIYLEVNGNYVFSDFARRVSNHQTSHVSECMIPRPASYHSLESLDTRNQSDDSVGPVTDMKKDN